MQTDYVYLYGLKERQHVLIDGQIWNVHQITFYDVVFCKGVWPSGGDTLIIPLADNPELEFEIVRLPS